MRSRRPLTGSAEKATPAARASTIRWTMTAGAPPLADRGRARPDRRAALRCCRERQTCSAASAHPSPRGSSSDRNWPAWECSAPSSSRAGRAHRERAGAERGDCAASSSRASARSPSPLKASGVDDKERRHVEAGPRERRQRGRLAADDRGCRPASCMARMPVMRQSQRSRNGAKPAGTIADRAPRARTAVSMRFCAAGVGRAAEAQAAIRRRRRAPASPERADEARRADGEADPEQEARRRAGSIAAQTQCRARAARAAPNRSRRRAARSPAPRSCGRSPARSR